MKGQSFGAFLSFITILGVNTPLARAQSNALKSVDWPLHNLDLAGSRFSPLDQINTSNVKSLTPRWLFQHGVIDGVSNQTTPVIVDGVMYVTDSRGSVYAVDAADGHLLWTYDVTNLIGGGSAQRATFSATAASAMQTASSTWRRAHSCLRSTRRPGSRFRASAKTVRPA